MFDEGDACVDELDDELMLVVFNRLVENAGVVIAAAAAVIVICAMEFVADT